LTDPFITSKCRRGHGRAYNLGHHLAWIILTKG
jgi:hypothetical protein